MSRSLTRLLARSASVRLVWLALAALGVLAPPLDAAAAPSTVIGSGVDSLADGLPNLFDPTIFWYSQPGCVPAPPNGPEEDPEAAALAATAGGAGAPGDAGGSGGANAPGDELLPAKILRTATWLTPFRQLFYFNPSRPVGTCNPYRLLSNLEADADALYFVDNQGPGGVPALWRRLRLANPADPSQLLATFPGEPSDFSAEVQLRFGALFLIRHSAGLDVIVQYDKLSGLVTDPVIGLGARFALRNMQVDDRFLWWLNGGTLLRHDLVNGNQIIAHAGYIDTYRVEYYDVECIPGEGCTEHSRVLVGRNNQLAVLDTLPVLSPLFPVYTSADPNARIKSITRDTNHYFFFEERVTGGGFGVTEHWLFRLPIGTSNPQLLFGPSNNGGFGYGDLRTDYVHLYFTDRAAHALKKLPNDAAAIPVVALRATGLEVTQGLQDPAHVVRLVRGRRTLVRLYHQADGAFAVSNVPALLDVWGASGYLGRLDPVNRTGKLQTAWGAPNRLAIDQAFLFELPLAWTNEPLLSFFGHVNPDRTLVELDSSNNSASRNVSLEPSPRLPLEILKFTFFMGGQLRLGGASDEYDAANWMRRLYPLEWMGGTLFHPGPGLRYSYRSIWDDGIVSWVDQTNADCKKKYEDTKKKIDDRNQCAVDYALNRIRAMRAAGELPQNRYYYAMIAQENGVPFTRGFAPGGDRISGGPSNDANYMSHEVGHTLGRGHPASGANPTCPGQDGADTAFPNPRARIGSSDDSVSDESALLGIDIGNWSVATTQLLPSSTRGDTMSYCSPYWISEYHYEGMLDFLNANPVNGPEQVGAPIAGDWLIATGGINLDSYSGVFNELRRTDAVAEVPSQTPGPFRLELRSGGTTLAFHAFTPEPNEDARIDVRSFFLVVPFEPGTTQIRVVENGTNRVLATKAVSASAPVVSNVALVNPPDPVSGTVTLGWDAVDDDGDPLRFDVLRTRDGGLSFEPVALSITTNSVDLDTSAWGGGTSALRVVASDGVLSGVGDGTPFEVENKAPIVRILTPADALRVPWGTLINFSAEVIDPQGELVPDANVSWANAYRVLGTGPAISVADLEVGTNEIVVVASNAAGLAAAAVVTVIVGDDLRFPGPKISATPSSIPFSVAATETALQSASLDLSNAGGGSLSASLASDQPWLTLDGGAGGTYFAPATISVQVDPTALPDATTSTASITIANIGDPTDVVVVPVTVAKGAVFTGTPYADSDGDGIEDAMDNCAFASNSDQLDRGGLGAGSAPDGVGDACQCGDLNGDGRISIADAVVLQRSLLQPPTATPARPDLCDVGGTAGCSIADAVVIRRALLSPPTAFLAPACVVVP